MVLRQWVWFITPQDRGDTIAVPDLSLIGCSFTLSLQEDYGRIHHSKIYAKNSSTYCVLLRTRFYMDYDEEPLLKTA
jgi:hypothetical protein